MSQTFQRPRGTIDWYGTKLTNLKSIEDAIKQIAARYGYSEIRTPIFEHTEVFIRSVGETSDIVTKEIYNFDDKGGRNITLRPEGTAGVIRAVNEDKLLQKTNLPLRLYYVGPVFRYERPQSGRARQFHQFGFEILNTQSNVDDLDVLLLAYDIVNALQLSKYHVELNCIGSIETRTKWINALKDYFKDYIDQLSEDSKNRLQTNPLRILDDKEDGKKDFVKNAPSITLFLSDQEKKNFNELTTVLTSLHVPYTINYGLVRGLDYYTDLVFEFVSDLDELKGQSTFCGGGRYNNLIAELGGINAQGVGFAFGLERLLIQYQVEHQLSDEGFSYNSDICVINLGNDPFAIEAFVHNLRAKKIAVGYEPSITKLNQGFKYGELMHAKFVFILGQKEWSNQQITIKNQQNFNQTTINLSDLDSFLINNKLI